MKYNLLCFQSSCRLIIFFHKHDYQVSTSLMKENKRCRRLKTAKWISIRRLVPGLLLTVRSAGMFSPPLPLVIGKDSPVYMISSLLFVRGGFSGGVQGGAHPPKHLPAPPKKYRNWHRLQTFALWQARFAFITQKSHQNVHKDLLRPKSIDTISF